MTSRADDLCASVFPGLGLRDVPKHPMLISVRDGSGAAAFAAGTTLEVWVDAAHK
jgi:hypothetical protein